VFSVAGGVVLSLIGIRMLAGTGTPDQTEVSPPSADPASSNVSYAPMILFAASPGTITGVITVAVAHSKDSIQDQSWLSPIDLGHGCDFRTKK